MINQLPFLLRVDQVAYLLQVHENTVRHYIEKKYLKAHNPEPGTKGLRIYETSLRAYLKKYAINEFNEHEYEEKLIETISHINGRRPLQGRRIISRGVIE